MRVVIFFFLFYDYSWDMFGLVFFFNFYLGSCFILIFLKKNKKNEIKLIAIGGSWGQCHSSSTIRCFQHSFSASLSCSTLLMMPQRGRRSQFVCSEEDLSFCLFSIFFSLLSFSLSCLLFRTLFKNLFVLSCLCQFDLWNLFFFFFVNHAYCLML